MESKNVAYLERLDHLRFFAAAMVLLFHTYLHLYNRPDAPKDPFSIPLIQQGHTGVPLFMIISGAILSIIVQGKELSVWNFYKNRVLRIYPLYVFVVALGYFATPDPRPTSTGTDFLMALLPISNLYRLQYGPFGGHLWSIAVELQFYLIFPLLLQVKIRQGTRYLLACVAGLVLLRVGVHKLTGSVHHLSFFSIFGSLDIFLVGMLVGEAYLKLRTAPAWWNSKWALVGMFVAINIGLYAIFKHRTFFHVDYARVSQSDTSTSRLWIIWPTLQAAAWGVFVLAYLSGTWRIPFSRAIAAGGKYSYSIYVWHMFIIYMLPTNLMTGLTAYTLGACVVLPATIAVAVASYYLIEQPFMSMRVKYATPAIASSELKVLAA